MATTVQQLMERTLKALIVVGEDASISAEQSEDYIKMLEDLVAELQSNDGVSLTWSTVDSVDDVLACPDSIIRSLALLMADEVASDYGVAITPDLDRKIRRARRQLLRVCTTRLGTYKPATLPIGTGNEDDGSVFDEHYYSGST